MLKVYHVVVLEKLDLRSGQRGSILDSVASCLHKCALSPCAKEVQFAVSDGTQKEYVRHAEQQKLCKVVCTWHYCAAGRT